MARIFLIGAGVLAMTFLAACNPLSSATGSRVQSLSGVYYPKKKVLSVNFVMDTEYPEDDPPKDLVISAEVKGKSGPAESQQNRKIDPSETDVNPQDVTTKVHSDTYNAQIRKLKIAPGTYPISFQVCRNGKGVTNLNGTLCQSVKKTIILDSAYRVTLQQ